MFLYSLYSKNIELIDVNSVTEQEMNLSQKNFSNQCEQTGRHTHMFHTSIKKKTLKGTPTFLCNEFSGVQFISSTCCRYILQSRHANCKGTHILIFYLKILRDCDNLISLGTRSHIFGLRNGFSAMSNGIYYSPL